MYFTLALGSAGFTRARGKKKITDAMDATPELRVDIVLTTGSAIPLRATNPALMSTAVIVRSLVWGERAGINDQIVAELADYAERSENSCESWNCT